MVGPSRASPDCRLIGDTLLYLKFARDRQGSGAKPRVSVVRCKPCVDPQDTGDLPKYLPAGLAPYVLNSTGSSPYYAATDDITKQVLRSEVFETTAHQLVRDRGGTDAVMNHTPGHELH